MDFLLFRFGFPCHGSLTLKWIKLQQTPELFSFCIADSVEWKSSPEHVIRESRFRITTTFVVDASYFCLSYYFDRNLWQFRVHRPKLANRPNRCSWSSLLKKEIYPITFVTNFLRYPVVAFSIGSPTFSTVSTSIRPRDNLCFLPHFILRKTKITTGSNAISKKKWKQIDGKCNSLSSPFNITTLSRAVFNYCRINKKYDSDFKVDNNF